MHESEMPEAWATPAKPSVAGIEEGLPTIELEHSKALARLRYKEADHTLIVEFRNGTIYRFFGVSRDDYTKLATSKSPGHRFNEHIQPYHEMERIA